MFTFAPFCPVWAENPLWWNDWGLLRDAEVNICRLLYSEDTTNDTPPIWGATSAFYPHNFSHQKSRKKSPWPEWKKFRKKFAGKCFGVRESPQSCGKGARGAKIWKNCMGKDSGIIRYYKMRVLSFYFRTIEPCWCLVGRCLYDLLSFGTWMRLVCRRR